MLYYLSELRDVFSSLNIFRYITFRAGMAVVTTFLICVVFGPWVIKKLRQMKVQEVAKRADCPDLDQFQHSKEGTPTMGGVFVIGSIVMTVLFWADLTNRYILLTLLTGVWLAVLGFVDDYMKLTRKGGKRGISKRTKLIWQILLGFFIGSYVYYDPSVSNKLDLPFFKEYLLDIGIFYIPFVALIIIGSSNAVNLTDGLDGLAIGCVLIVSITLGVLSYITGHFEMSQYLYIPFVSGSGELAIVCAAILGASLGFLWFNCHPASVFMGDVGSLSLGGMLGAMSIFIKKELLLALLGGIFVIEAVSVILQVYSVRYRGKKLFKIAPIHHHFQMCGWHESKIIIRFWIIAIIFALLTLTSLKVR